MTVGRTISIPTARAYLPLLKPSRYKGLYGGRGSGKSHEFAGLLIDDCITNPGLRSVCVREVQNTLDQSVKRLLEDKIRAYNLERDFKVTNTHIITPGDGITIFKGMQEYTADNIKSLEGFGRAWVEEAQSVSQRSLDLLRPTIRRPGSEIWLSWNPRKETDPVDRFLRGTDAPPDSIVIGTTYRDNPWFPDVLRRDMEWDRAKDPDKHAHIWEGKYEEHSEARVFHNWRVEDFETPKNAMFYSGADWGYSVDPTTLVRTFVEQTNPQTGEPWRWTDPVSGITRDKTRLYIDQELYAIGIEIDHLPAFFDQMGAGAMREWEVIADSARPETISYLQRHGYSRMKGAQKGPNSVKEGVIFLQSFDIIIHPRCTHTIDEFDNYSYKRDPLTQKPTPILEDKKNHIIDPVRYAVEAARHVLEWATW